MSVYTFFFGVYPALPIKGGNEVEGKEPGL